MPTEFINTCRTSGGDYSNPTVWETQTEGDYTTGAFLVFAISASVGTLSDNDSVVGGTSGATGTVIATPTSTQILVQDYYRHLPDMRLQRVKLEPRREEIRYYDK